MQKNFKVKIMFIGGAQLEIRLSAIDEQAFRNWLRSSDYGEFHEWDGYMINKANILYLFFQIED